MVSKVRKVKCQNNGHLPITHGVMSLGIISNFAIHENFCKRLLRIKESLKVESLMDNKWMYCVYRNRGKGSITLGVVSLFRFPNN